MKILIVHPHDVFSLEEPWTRRIRSIAARLIQKGHQVSLCFFPALFDASLRKFDRDRITYIPLSRLPSLRQIIRNIVTVMTAAKKADLMHLQKCHPHAALPVLITAYLCRVPLHYDWDDWEEKIWLESCGRGLHSLGIAFIFRVLEAALPRLADSTTSASRFLAELAVWRGARKEYLRPAPVGVDRELFNDSIDSGSVREKHKIAEGTAIVLYVGQLQGSQYVDLFIQAVNIVLHRTERRVPFKAIVVGDGYWRPWLMQYAREWGLSGDIIFTGAVSPDLVPKYIHAASVCVAPFKDTLVTRCKSPLKIVEYMGYGKYIVASAVGEVVNMVGGCAYLAQAGSARSLAEGIDYFLSRLSDDQLKETINARLKQRLQHTYTWEYTVNNLTALYEKIVR